MNRPVPEMEITAGFWIRCSLLLLLIPLPWALGAVGSAAVHELAHILCIWAAGGSVPKIRLGAGGARICTYGLGPGQELAAALAGPAGSLLLIFLLRIAPRTALCGLVQGMFNLIPVYPLDGGRALHCLLVLLAGEKQGARISRLLNWGILGFMTAAAAALSGERGEKEILFLVLLLILGKMKKYPCKDRISALQ